MLPFTAMDPASSPSVQKRLRQRPAAILLSLAAAAILISSLAPAGGGAAPGPPPKPLPASLDPGFLRDLGTLAAFPPEDAVVTVVPPEHRGSIASWYWIMAAFAHPEMVWMLERSVPSGDWAVCPLTISLERPWRKVRCQKEWCLWHR